MLYAVKLTVQLICGTNRNFLRKVAHETFEPIELARVDAGRLQVQRIGIRLVPVKAGIDDGRQADAGGAGDTQTVSEGIHRIPDAPGACAARKQQQPYASDQDRLNKETGLGDGLVLGITRILVPVDMHVVRYDAAFSGGSFFCHILSFRGVVNNFILLNFFADIKDFSACD